MKQLPFSIWRESKGYLSQDKAYVEMIKNDMAYDEATGERFERMWDKIFCVYIDHCNENNLKIVWDE